MTAIEVRGTRRIHVPTARFQIRLHNLNCQYARQLNLTRNNRHNQIKRRTRHTFTRPQREVAADDAIHFDAGLSQIYGAMAQFPPDNFFRCPQKGNVTALFGGLGPSSYDKICNTHVTPFIICG